MKRLLAVLLLSVSLSAASANPITIKHERQKLLYFTTPVVSNMSIPTGWHVEHVFATKDFIILVIEENG